MGRVFLVAIVVGLVWGGYQIYRNISGLTDPEALASRYHGDDSVAPPAAAKSSEGDSGEAVKVVPARSWSQEKPEKAEPLAVLASTAEFVYIEAWGPAVPGDELPDGSILRCWSDGEALVTSQTGQLERRRFRRFSEAMALVAPVMASAVQSSAPVVPGTPISPIPLGGTRE